MTDKLVGLLEYWDMWQMSWWWVSYESTLSTHTASNITWRWIWKRRQALNGYLDASLLLLLLATWTHPFYCSYWLPGRITSIAPIGYLNTSLLLLLLATWKHHIYWFYWLHGQSTYYCSYWIPGHNTPIGYLVTALLLATWTKHSYWLHGHSSPIGYLDTALLLTAWTHHSY